MLIGIIMIPLLLLLIRKKTENMETKKSWVIFMVLLTVSSFLGFITHYFFVRELSFKIIWIPLYALMFATVNSFYFLNLKLLGSPKFKLNLIIISVLTLTFWLYIEYAEFIEWSNPIRVFIIYVFITALSAFGMVIYLAVKKKHSGSQILLCSLLPLLIAGFFQLKREILVHFIWDFNEDGLAHIFIIIGIVIIFVSAMKSLEEPETDL